MTLVPFGGYKTWRDKLTHYDFKDDVIHDLEAVEAKVKVLYVKAMSDKSPELAEEIHATEAQRAYLKGVYLRLPSRA